MARLYFVAPWFPERPVGGAELLVRRTVEHLAADGVEVAVLTTCVPEFRADWGISALPRGAGRVGGVQVERFAVDRRDWRLFDQVNLRVMRGEQITAPEARIYVDESIRSRALEAKLSKLPPDALCVYVPYMFGTTYWGIRARPGWLWPCLHDEPYAYLAPIAETFQRARGVLCNALAEADLVRRLYPSIEAPICAVGVGVDPGPPGDARAFRARHRIERPFVVCVGRKDHGKNVDRLLADFERYVRRDDSSADLVLIGPGSIPIPPGLRERVHDLGLVDEVTRRDAVAAAVALCVPSVNESFSFVLMEAWQLGVPTLVNADCPVTREHVYAARGGLAYRGADELAGAIDWLIEHPDRAARMARNGGEYVRRNFDWPVIVARLRRTLAL